MARARSRRDQAALVASLALPPLVCLALVPVRGEFASTNAALVLVLAVVAVAATGDRISGVLASLSSGLWFDFFLTEPYQRFTINDRDDVETAVLLLLVGVGVTELAIWGRRQQAQVSRDSGYLAGIHEAAESVARGGGSPSEVIARVTRQLTELFDLRSCVFDYGTGLDHPRLTHDGKVVWRHAEWDVAAHGLPTEKPIEILVESGGSFKGRFLMTASPGTRPARGQYLVATSLAAAAGAALAEYDSRGR